MTVSRYRPLIPILGLSSDHTTLRRLSLIWGINPLKVDYSDDMNVITEMAQKAAVENGFKQGDKLVITASVPAGGHTNMIKVLVI